MKRIVLVTGGSRSGKSKHALEVSVPYKNKAFIATAEPIDDDMRVRIELHRRERGTSFFTVEEPVDLATALMSLPDKMEVAVLDCITVWLGNLIYRDRIRNGTCAEVESFLDTLNAPPCHLILVTNEVGMGIIPGDAATRRFRDLAGKINQQLAQVAHEVILTVCGIPVRIK